MTEYEMASLANDMLSTSNTILTTCFTVISAFVVVSYLVAHRLSRTMTVIVIALHIVWSLSLWAQASFALRSYYKLLRKMRNTAEPNGIFDWISPELAPSWLTDARPEMIGISLLLAVLASVYFFFHCRRVNRKAETVVEAPKV